MIDTDLKKNVQAALDWDPSLDASDVGVSVAEGVVTLRGNVASYPEKLAAERVAQRVFGVKAVANDLMVHIPTAFQHTDTELAQAAVAGLEWSAVVPRGRLEVTVTDGWVTLKGTLDSQYQREAAVRAIHDLHGVKGVRNEIALTAQVSPADVRDKIEAAFRRSAEIDARCISVAAADGKVILSGNVRSWSERTQAARAAWAAPGVRQVEDRMAVVP